MVTLSLERMDQTVTLSLKRMDQTIRTMQEENLYMHVGILQWEIAILESKKDCVKNYVILLTVEKLVGSAQTLMRRDVSQMISRIEHAHLCGI